MRLLVSEKTFGVRLVLVFCRQNFAVVVLLVAVLDRGELLPAPCVDLAKRALPIAPSCVVEVCAETGFREVYRPALRWSSLQS